MIPQKNYDTHFYIVIILLLLPPTNQPIKHMINCLGYQILSEHGYLHPNAILQGIIIKLYIIFFILMNDGIKNKKFNS